MRKTNRPLILTVNGKPELVVQTAESYQHLLDLAARQNVSEGIRQGLEDIRQRRSRPASEVFADFESKRGIKPLPHGHGSETLTPILQLSSSSAEPKT